jgi:hypothetical protein
MKIEGKHTTGRLTPKWKQLVRKNVTHNKECGQGGALTR